MLWVYGLYGAGTAKGAEMRYIAIIFDILAAIMWAYKGNVPMMIFFLALTLILIVSDLS